MPSREPSRDAAQGAPSPRPARVPPGVEASVTYGMWETDPDSPPSYHGRMQRDGSIRLLPQRGVRRRRYVFWREANGEEWGYWEWERKP